ncbi:MAG TPA: hypothetical protein VM261_12335 [Kofleriaceae bacterium]|nr:hypothetical protein [Kofleriaceae bacterium]
MDDDYEGYGRRYMMEAILDVVRPTALVIGLVSTIFPILLYVIARWRDHKSEVPDEQLGLKFALHFFRAQSYQLLLFGTAMLLYSMLTKEMKGELREYIWRPAMAFIVSSGIVFGVATAVLSRTNNHHFPSVGRLFNGYNLMVSGLIGFAALTAGFQAMFQKGSSGEFGRIAWTGILVYTTAWVVQGAIFGRSVLEAAPTRYDAPSSTGSSSNDPPPPAMPGPMQKPLA